MATINIGIGHDDDFVISDLSQIEEFFFFLFIFLFFAFTLATGIITGNTCADGLDYRKKLFIVKNLCFLSLLNVKHLTPKGEDGLEVSVSSTLCRTTGRVTLYNKELTLLRIMH